MFRDSYLKLKQEVDPMLDKDVDVPIPKDPAGGYTHDQHKNNYVLMFNAGLLYQFTGDVKYAALVKSILLKYAKMNPGLKNHPESTGKYPGRLFWQSLNDANWLMYAGLAMDCIHDYLSPSERKVIADGAFKPLVDYFTKDIHGWFDLIHNHAVYACAGVGIVGIATDRPEYLEMALKGSDLKGKSGFLAQMNGLFSPDGFYHEGPYYTRYAILPFYIFANAIDHVKPDLKIFAYRNSILKKALNVALQQTNLDGIFFSYNDALKDKSYVSGEVVYAVDLAVQYYGKDTSLLAVAQQQNRVVMCTGGETISKTLSQFPNKKYQFSYQSGVYKDGAEGDQGGVSVLRSSSGNDLSTLICKYTSHGLSHGHFDKLNIQFFDKGNEILQDYGAVRFINIEQKWGGRYLKETDSYAKQTIAHNTLTVDETSHYNGNEALSEANHPSELFADIQRKNVKAVSVIDTTAYQGVKMHRSDYLIDLSTTQKRLIIDIFRIQSAQSHQYDLPFNYAGTLIKTNFKYNNFDTALTTLGHRNGYQHIWKLAEAKSVSPFTQFTFLNHQTFYTISSLAADRPDVFLTTSGASDPDFNLRKEPAYMLRGKGSDYTFINVIERHGSFSPVTEIATTSYPQVAAIRKIADDDRFTVAEVDIEKESLLLIQCNSDYDSTSKHEYSYQGNLFQWTGPYVLIFKNQIIN